MTDIKVELGPGSFELDSVCLTITTGSGLIEGETIERFLWYREHYVKAQKQLYNLERETFILRQAFDAIATPQEYKLVMDEIKNSLKD